MNPEEVTNEVCRVPAQATTEKGQQGERKLRKNPLLGKRICNFQLSSILFIYQFLTICKINNLKYISANSARDACEQEDQIDKDPFLTLARKEHEAKMRILQLKEWKLKNHCMQMGIGLPPDVSQKYEDVYP